MLGVVHIFRLIMIIISGVRRSEIGPSAKHLTCHPAKEAQVAYSRSSDL